MADDYDYDLNEFPIKTPPEFFNLDDPEYIAKILKGKKLRIPFRPHMEDVDGNLLYRIKCRNHCCISNETVIVSPNESDESLSDKVKQLLNFPCKFENLSEE